MEFWSVEVESGTPFKVRLEAEVLYIFQASLGEVKKKKDEFINLHITVDAEKHLVGTLHPKRLPQNVYVYIVLILEFGVVYSLTTLRVCYVITDPKVHTNSADDQDKHDSFDDDKDNVEEQDATNKQYKKNSLNVTAKEKKVGKAQKRAATSTPDGGKKSNQKKQRF
ncbi:unnamed protein product [Lactuca saligna]|uniref:Nucleoplasmin-like domain-containing protein n=1 Tax=Lactuca saligna TaxID=75948 RepID=A0AA36E4U1_LACSI|nr:unnamed protein product [Lactuca saligna]